MISKKHQIFINEAMNEAKKSMMNKRHGCVITYNNIIVSKGFNFITNELKHKYSIHAEISAINNLLKQKKSRTFSAINNKNLIMYVVRIDNDLKLKQSIPCEHCKKHILKKNINTVFYSLNESEIL